MDGTYWMVWWMVPCSTWLTLESESGMCSWFTNIDHDRNFGWLWRDLEYEDEASGREECGGSRPLVVVDCIIVILLLESEHVVGVENAVTVRCQSRNAVWRLPQMMMIINIIIIILVVVAIHRSRRPRRVVLFLRQSIAAIVMATVHFFFRGLDSFVLLSSLSSFRLQIIIS